jgi:hypothetical protein
MALKGCKRICDMSITGKVTIGVILVDPSNSVKVIGSEAGPPSLPEVSRCEREDKRQGDAQPEIGRCEEEVVVSV